MISWSSETQSTEQAAGNIPERENGFRSTHILSDRHEY